VSRSPPCSGSVPSVSAAWSMRKGLGCVSGFSRSGSNIAMPRAVPKPDAASGRRPGAHLLAVAARQAVLDREHILGERVFLESRATLCGVRRATPRVVHR